MNLERVSLDQLRVLSVVAEAGSFSAAARRLQRVQSAVSHTVAALEQQLGVALFDRSGYRPRLTSAGEAILGEARDILVRTDHLQARARAMAAGLESELGLVVDVLFPTDTLTRALDAFRGQFPTVELHLFVESLGAVAQKVLEATCQVGISCTLPDIPRGLTVSTMPPVTLVAVAAAGHPLARAAQPLDDADIRGHLQLVLTDRSPLTAGRDWAVYATRTWRLGDLGMKHRLLQAGIGWGTMPVHLVADDLAQGRLVELAVASHPRDGEVLPVRCITREGAPLGPAARWLTRWFQSVEDYDR